MLPDSTNPRVMADNIRRLQTEVENAVELPSVQTTDEGKILTVNASGKWAALDPASQLPAVTAIDEGSLLTVNSNGEWSKGSPIIGNLDYSTTEQDTGLKWIDGKSIYVKTYTGTFESTAGLNTLFTDNTIDTLIDSKLRSISSGNNMVVNFSTLQAYINTTTHNCIVNVPEGYVSKDYSITVIYTKTSPTREPDDEPEVKKATKKKTTTKGEN